MQHPSSSTSRPDADIPPKSKPQRRTRTRIPRKRGRTFEPQQVLFPSPPRSRSATRRPTKKHKAHHIEAEEEASASALRPAQFWDNLSRVPLVRSALEELDRRNSLNSTVLNPVVSNHRDLASYARHGGPALSNIRGAQDMERGFDRRHNRARGGIRKPQARGTRGSRSGSRSTAPITKSSSPYDAAFRQHLVDWRIWPINHYLETGDLPPPPDNLEAIRREVCGGRGSLEPESFTDEDHRNFQKAYSLAFSEESRSRTLDTIEGLTLALSSAHIKRGPIKLTNLNPLTPANLVPGNPDRAYGSRSETLDASVRRQLGKLILPTTAQDILCPNFVIHVKGPGGRTETAEIQAVYDGALAARAMEALWEFGSNGEDYAPTARALTCTFVDGVLKMFAVTRLSRSRTLGHGVGSLQRLHPEARSSPADVEYVTTRIGSWFVHDELDHFRRGAAAFRNGLEWARQQREEAIERANRKIAALGTSEDCSAFPASGSQSSVDPIV